MKDFTVILIACVAATCVVAYSAGRDDTINDRMDTALADIDASRIGLSQERFEAECNDYTLHMRKEHREGYTHIVMRQEDWLNCINKKKETTHDDGGNVRSEGKRTVVPGKVPAGRALLVSNGGRPDVD